MDSLRSNIKPIQLQSVRGFHLGGGAVSLAGLPTTTIQSVPGVSPRKSDPNGHYMVGQLYAQYFALVEPRTEMPVLLWHGGGMTGSTWEQTPDGRPGWHEFFMRWGVDTCVSDAVDRGRASVAPPLIVDEAAEYRTIEQAWSIFRLGASGNCSVSKNESRAYPNQRFPIPALSELARQFVGRRIQSTSATIEAYHQLVKKMGKSVIVAHSEGARHAMKIATLAPENVAALVLVEPAGAPDLADVEFSKLAGIPHLVVWGDHFQESELWANYRHQCDKWFEAFSVSGGRVDVIDLPKLGIYGNSHLLMMDENSDEIAAMVTAWLERHLKI